ncbi:MAG TPA: hypothetical protein PLA41_02050 [Candidatus Pacearchaeota archaeon]|nr:hypothetical protein [Candidatus Parcubacteria bacterium]HNZ84011.1 hypothetical protein [Candidatus Pacearchaeota archaeon]HOU45911.1 hypothetical protein [Candidatus Pacearchaeota archaeon]
MKLFISLLYKMRKFRTVLLSGDNSKLCAEILYQLLKDDFNVKTFFSTNEFSNALDFLSNDILIYIFDLEKEYGKIVEMFSGIESPIVVFNGNKQKEKTGNELEVEYLMENLSNNALIFFNNDNISLSENVKRGEKIIKTCSIENKGTIYASDIVNDGQELNFKINHEGNTIPFWIKGRYSIQEIYPILSAVLVAMNLGFNLVAISERLREYHRAD